jgi:hypothetical protein
VQQRVRFGANKEKLTITGLAIRSNRADRSEQVLAMNIRLAFVIGAGLAVSGCCTGVGYYIPPPSSALTRWDGFGPSLKAKNVKRAKARKSETVAPFDESPKEAELASLKPYSEDWWSVRDAIDRADEVKLAKKLIICRNCMPSKPDEDLTGSATQTFVEPTARPSVGQKRANKGY